MPLVMTLFEPISN
jgi:hypothetical protein